MLTFTTITTAALCTTVFISLFTYQRRGARFRKCVSGMATALMAASGAVVIFVIDGQLCVSPYAWPLIILLGLFTVLIVRCDGNLSDVLRGPNYWWRDR